MEAPRTESLEDYGITDDMLYQDYFPWTWKESLNVVAEKEFVQAMKKTLTKDFFELTEEKRQEEANRIKHERSEIELRHLRLKFGGRQHASLKKLREAVLKEVREDLKGTDPEGHLRNNPFIEIAAKFVWYTGGRRAVHLGQPWGTYISMSELYARLREIFSAVHDNTNPPIKSATQTRQFGPAQLFTQVFFVLRKEKTWLEEERTKWPETAQAEHERRLSAIASYITGVKVELENAYAGNQAGYARVNAFAEDSALSGLRLFFKGIVWREMEIATIEKDTAERERDWEAVDTFKETIQWLKASLPEIGDVSKEEAIMELKRIINDGITRTAKELRRVLGIAMMLQDILNQMLFAGKPFHQAMRQQQRALFQSVPEEEEGKARKRVTFDPPTLPIPEPEQAPEGMTREEAKRWGKHRRTEARMRGLADKLELLFF